MHARLKVAAAVLVAIGANGARAQGIPVIDVANLVQTIQQVLDGITQINNQVQQINQLQSQINSINGVRNLGNVFNNPLLKNYVPAEAYTYVNAINTSGYSGLNATAKALRDVGMVYNLANFVRAREGYSWMFLQRDFDQVARMAVPAVFADYNRQFEGDTALQKKIGAAEDWRINVIGVRLAASGRAGNQGEATVTYDKVVRLSLSMGYGLDCAFSP